MTLKAKEMFEKLGYKQFDNHMLEPTPAGYFVTQDDPYIEYAEENDYGRESITFYSGRLIFVSAHKKYSDGRMARLPASLNMKEISAIVQQCKELGWIEDE